LKYRGVRSKNRPAVGRMTFRLLSIWITACCVFTTLNVQAQTTSPDSSALPYPMRDSRSPLQRGRNPLGLKPPTTLVYEYDPLTGRYVVREKVGQLNIGEPIPMSYEEFLRYERERGKDSYWKERNSGQTSGSIERQGVIPKIYVGPKVFDKIFGGSFVDIRPQGSAELRFAGNFNRIDNPNLTVQQRRIGNFDFDMNIQLTVVGTIGEKLKFTASQNTQAVFNFENQMKLEYTGYEDEIIKKIEVGNVALPLRSALIQGSQSLFGIKTELQFGRLRVTSVLTQQRGESQQVVLQGGGQATQFDIGADQYDANRHFFLTQEFRNRFNGAMATLPVVRSNIIVTRVEVWVTNRNQISADVRDVLGFMDLGENNPHNPAIFGNGSAIPGNGANSLYGELTSPGNADLRAVNTALDILQTRFPFNQLANTGDYEITFARKLDPTQYTLNPLLGYISLNTSLNNDEVLAVAFEYTVNGVLYRVGEFSQEVPNDQTNPTVLFLKLLKGTNIRTDLPIWDLMMKNIYSLNAFGINKTDFTLNLVYNDVLTGNKNFIPEGSISGRQLIQVLGVDRLNVQLEPQPDGFYDFVENVTIDAAKGRVILPLVEPFGKDLAAAFDAAGPTPEAVKRRYVFSPLYDSTRAWAQQFPELNRYRLVGRFQSSSGSEISVGAMNLPPGSVRVMAGTRTLTEGSDYTVDYTLGRVKILNTGLLSSGEQITVNFENSPLFQTTARTLSATRFDYRVNRDINLGGTLLHLNERPITPKVNIGDEPISNTMLGLDASVQTESKFVTKLVDGIPFLETKEASVIQLSGEYARLLPGNARAIGAGGISYIDDFEAAENSISITSPALWQHASTPSPFTESSLRNNLANGFNRAKVLWYNIDPLFFSNSNITPVHIRDDLEMKSNHYMRQVLEQEVFPNKQLANNQPQNIATFDMAYYPNQRGIYNYDAEPTQYSAGVDANGNLLNPTTRWGGLQRKIETNDFEAANIEFLEFWMMDPYIYKPNHSGGDLFINLGTVSEDLLKDGRRGYENGFPRADGSGSIDTTVWGLVPRLQPLVNAFDNDPASRVTQDVGLDGLNDEQERTFFQAYLARLEALHGVASPAYQKAFTDPANDNYHHFRGSDYDNAQLDVLQRYKLFNGQQGNSPTDQQSPEPYPTSATNLPNTEDINIDNTLSQNEDYYEYRVSLRPADMVIGRNYITDIFKATVQLRNRTSAEVNWYQFRVPVQKPDRRVGNVFDYKSIRFVRMYFAGFDDSVVCRFATLSLVRTDWRRYLADLQAPGEYVPTDPEESTTFLLSTVNIEENGNRLPVPYVVPPGIERVRNVFTTNFQQLNEQSMQLRFCNLRDGDARAAFKNTTFDIRAYKRIEMFVHAEGPLLQDGDVRMFVRFGNDYVFNYYEYEQPLVITPEGTSDPNVIWPTANSLNVTFAELNSAKQARNRANWPFNVPYVFINDRGHRITVLGNPNLSTVQSIMMGVRNPKANNNNPGDDGLDKCGEVWFNELRLTEFDNRDGWAATGQMNVKLADFGTVSVTGLRKTIGFGGVESKVSDRNRDDLFQYDLASTFEMGKFFPERYGLRIPLYFGFGEMFSTPEFNPIDRDILLENVLNDFDDPAARDSVRTVTQTYMLRRSINVTNMQKMRTRQRKPQLWDIENLNLTLSYSENYNRNPFTAYNTLKNYRASVGYNYTGQPKNYRPFAKAVKGKSLLWIKDFNFYLMPQSLSLRTDVDRMFQETQLRNNSAGGVGISPTWNKNFTFNRFYNMRYDLSRSLKLEYDATMNTRIDEPFGRIDTDEKRDTVINNFRNLGRPTRYQQSINLNYQLPFNKFKMLDWVTSSYQYQGTYEWTAAPLAADSLGNIIQNSQTNRFNATLNMMSLYNKVGVLRKINLDQPLRDKKKDEKKKKKEGEKEQPNRNQFGENGNAVSQQDREDYSRNLGRNLVKAVMMLKNVSANYSVTQGTILPGFTQDPQYFGNNFDNNAPGYRFVLGFQDDIRARVLQNGWLTGDTNLNALYTNTRNINLQGQATLEPFKEFRITLSITRTQNYRYTENFRAGTNGDILSINQLETGDYSVSTITWNTAFERLITDPTQPGYLESDVFRRFELNRLVVADRLAALNDNSVGRGAVDSLFPDGYSRKSLDVLVPSFIAAYTGQSAESVDLGFFPKIPLPNWRITYSGLVKKAFFKEYFQSITFNHSYRSTYTVGNFTTNLIYGDPTQPASIRDTLLNRDFYPRYQISQITISEQFAPLAGVDFTLKNNITARIEYKQMRTLTLTLINNRLNEMRSNEFTIGLGYRFTSDMLPFLFNGKASKTANDLNARLDVNIRDNYNILRDLDGAEPQPSGGGRNVSLKPSIDYVLNDRVNIRLFYDYVLNEPFISTAFPTAQTSGGLSIRFTIAN
jgi:cell surface protein SprA